MHGVTKSWFGRTSNLPIGDFSFFLTKPCKIRHGLLSPILLSDWLNISRSKNAFPWQGLELGPPGWQFTALSTRPSWHAYKFAQKYLNLSYICKFLLSVANYCKISQIRYLILPITIIDVSNNWEVKTTKCLIWYHPGPNLSAEPFGRTSAIFDHIFGLKLTKSQST